MHTIKAALLLSLGLFAGLNSASSDREETLKLSTVRDTYFRNYFYTGSQYLHFRSDGTYRRIAREHMFVDEEDHGSWVQTTNGEVTLVSMEHYRNVECGSLTIYLWHKEHLNRLTSLKASISKLLARNSANTIGSGEIESIEKYGYENSLSRVSVEPLTNSVPRADLNCLIDRIHKFTNDPEKNHFHLAPMTYKGADFLLWLDSETSFNRDLPKIKKALDNAGGDQRVAHIFLAIDRGTFERESATTQEFLFFPQLNKRSIETEGTK